MDQTTTEILWTRSTRRYCGPDHHRNTVDHADREIMWTGPQQITVDQPFLTAILNRYRDTVKQTTTETVDRTTMEVDQASKVIL